jgi:hypothetical protein
MPAGFVADVIKVEPQAFRDPLRKWRLLEDGTPFGGEFSPEICGSLPSTRGQPKVTPL